MSIDLITILGNLSQALLPVQKLITGGAYILGLIFFISAVNKLKAIGDQRAHSSSQEKLFVPLAYIMFGTGLLYIPTALNILANTTFGADNILTYSSSKPNFFNSMAIVIRTAGLIWFVRGAILLSHASQPGSQDGPKGLVFVFAGILSMNFDGTLSALNWVLNHLMSWSASITHS